MGFAEVATLIGDFTPRRADSTGPSSEREDVRGGRLTIVSSPGDRIVRNVVERNRPIRQLAKQAQTKVSCVRSGNLACHRLSNSFIALAAPRLGRHRMATFGTAPTRLDAILHSTDTLTITGAFGADLRTLLADVSMVWRFQQHEMRGGAAHLCARHHKLKMFRFDVGAAAFQTMSHRRPQTRAITAQTLVDTDLHLVFHLHLICSFAWLPSIAR